MQFASQILDWQVTFYCDVPKDGTAAVAAAQVVHRRGRGEHGRRSALDAIEATITERPQTFPSNGLRHRQCWFRVWIVRKLFQLADVCFELLWQVWDLLDLRDQLGNGFLVDLASHEKSAAHLRQIFDNFPREVM